MKKDSSDSSDDSDDDDKPAAAGSKKPVVQVAKTNGKVTANGKSSSSDDDSSDSDGKASKPPVLANKSLNKSSVVKKDSSSESSDSDSDDKTSKLVAKTPAKQLSPTKTSTPNNFKPVKFVSGGFSQPTVLQPTKQSSSDEDSSDAESDNNQTPVQNKNNSTTVVAGKKRKLSENGDLPIAKKVANNTTKSFNNSSNSKPNTPFRRVKTEEVEVDTRLANNSFDAKVNKMNYLQEFFKFETNAIDVI